MANNRTLLLLSIAVTVIVYLLGKKSACGCGGGDPRSVIADNPPSWTRGAARHPAPCTMERENALGG